MKGRHSLRVQSAHLCYDMTFTHNLTVIQGDSATGKTTLVDMVQEYLLNGSDTGISLVCDVPCRVIAGNTWQEQLRGIENSMVFIDEGNRFISSDDFSKAVCGSSNYYVIVTREALDNLPYSVTEIYGIKSSGKYGSLEPVYHHMYRIYSDIVFPQKNLNVLVTEYTNSGYDFFSALPPKECTRCIAAGGLSNIFSVLQELDQYEQALVVADGAAFGSQMGRVYQLIQRRKGICLYLPESFEWLILSSGILNDKKIKTILENPYDYIDGKEFFSWERYFTSLLIEKTHGTWLQYSKGSLNPVYLHGKLMQQILAALPKDIRKLLSI